MSTLSSGICLYSETIYGLDATQTGATRIRTTDANERFVPMFVNVEAIELDSFTSVPTISVGTNSSSYDNILSSTVLSGLNVANNVINYSIPSPTRSISPNTDVYVKITGGVGTNYILRVSLLGLATNCFCL